MRTPSDPAAAQALADAVDAPERAPRARLRVDWNGTGGFDHPLSDLSTVAGDIVVDRQITGDLPEECTLIEGYTTATLSTTLAGQRPGDPRDVARMLSPFRTDSALTEQQLVDADLTCDIGLLTNAGREMLRQFTGSTRTLELSASDRTVALSALDPAEKLRASITLPPVAQEEEEAYNTVEWLYQQRINTQWVVDYVLRRNGIYASPPPRPGCLFSMTCHGGLVADVATQTSLGVGQASAVAPPFIPGPFGMLAANATPSMSTLTSATATGPFQPGAPDTAYLFEFWCQAGAANTFAPQRDGTVLEIASKNATRVGVTYQIGLSTAGQLWAKIYSDATVVATINGPKLTGPAAWHQVGVWIRYRPGAKTLETRWLLDGMVGAASTITATITSLAANDFADVAATTPVPVACLQISTATQPPSDWAASWMSQADIDVGLNWMTGLPDIVAADSFDVLKQAVGAEFGVITFTEDGRFRFLNRDTVRSLASRPPVATLTAARELQTFSLSTSLDSVRNGITMTVTPRLHQRLFANVYEAATADELATPAGTSTRTITLQKRCTLTYAETFSTMTASGYRDGNYGYLSACRAYRADTDDEVTSNVTITGRAIGDDRVRLTFVNNTGGPLHYGLDDRTPAFRLVNYPVINGRTQVYRAADDTSITRYGRRTLAVPDNPFRQTLDSAQAITASLLADLARPTTVLKDITVTGDPRGQLLDPVTIADPSGLGGPIPAVVIGHRRTLNTSDGLTDQLTLRVRR